MGELLSGWKRDFMCGNLNKNHDQQTVTIMGWVQKRRDLGNLIFVDLRDRTGIVQIVFNVSQCIQHFEKAQSLRNEYVLAVKGKVVQRSPETVNSKIATGEIEIIVYELKLLNKAETPPFAIEDDSKVSDSLRLKYRYLDLRRSEMQKNLMLRHKISKCARAYLDQNEFIEIETPMLTKSTPEGARDYLVPSRLHPSEFYALPQSPQLFKQILMLSGFDRYYQIVRCFRDEDLRADRQPEFTQIDIEMSFVEVEDVIKVNEGLLQEIFSNIMGIQLELPLPQLTYREAMDRYGSDKPDTRFGLELKNISDLVHESEFKVFTNAIENGGSVRGINAKGCLNSFARREIDSLVDYVKIYKAKGLTWIQLTEEGIKSPISKFFSNEQMQNIINRLEGKIGDIIFIIADKNEIVYDALGQLRLELARKLSLIHKDELSLLWVTEFPLLEYNEEEKRYVAKHHPFTSPLDEDIELLDTIPQNIRSKAYDIVLNGIEIGGGSIRIDNTELQQKIFYLLGFTKEDSWDRFGFLLEAFKYGAPPHGGIAYGLDRLTMILAGRDTIRDVIAFPKVQNASCPMTNAPSKVDLKQLKELHIKTE